VDPTGHVLHPVVGAILNGGASAGIYALIQYGQGKDITTSGLVAAFINGTIQGAIGSIVPAYGGYTAAKLFSLGRILLGICSGSVTAMSKQGFEAALEGREFSARDLIYDSLVSGALTGVQCALPAENLLKSVLTSAQAEGARATVEMILRKLLNQQDATDPGVGESTSNN